MICSKCGKKISSKDIKCKYCKEPILLQSDIRFQNGKANKKSNKTILLFLLAGIILLAIATALVLLLK